VAFLLVGIAGFIPGITTSYSKMKVWGMESDAKLLGVFNVSVLHNIVHLLFGIVGLAMLATAMRARTYLVTGGVIYIVLTLYGAFVDRNSNANFVPINTADNWLHLVLGAGMILLGFLLYRRQHVDAGPVRTY
jgi:MFS-type transporter involved in bile tolerance (Atg22 family)